MTKAEAKRIVQEEARESLRKILRPGDTIYTVLRHTSASGMSRNIDAYAIKDNAPRYLTSLIARADGHRQARDGSIVMGGCGMDMGFQLVYTTSSALFPVYRCLGAPQDGVRCPSNHHINNWADQDFTRDHNDGYALRHAWL